MPDDTKSMLLSAEFILGHAYNLADKGLPADVADAVQQVRSAAGYLVVLLRRSEEEAKELPWTQPRRDRS